ncbi:MAG: MerR family DNA-binding transcriptional regulator [Rhizobiales bacterium]|nr:MerR family DNA-binding transcriptional regulator [Hyphomicrobiales bacterium]
MQIGELARRFGVAPSKIRFLEDEGLVRPVRRTKAGYREYDEGSAEALAMILQASLGFTLDEIKGALAQTKEHGLRLDYLIGQIARKLTELDRHIAQAQELRGRLVCAGNELKARLKNGPNCEARPAALSSPRAARPRAVQRAQR